MKYKKGIYLVYNTDFRFLNIKDKLIHIWRVIITKPMTVQTYIHPKDIEEFKRK